MGNQGTATNGLRTGVEIIRSGALGDVRVVHLWTNRPIWPQGQRRPTATPAVPATLDWEQWLGPASQRPYHNSYLPFNWRGWWDFGTGAIGDMACHTMNLPFMALRLGAPSTIQAQVPGGVNPDSPPVGCTVTYQFPARENLPACQLVWYERGRPPMELMLGQQPGGSGCLIIGSRGTMYSGSDYGDSYRLLPEANFRDYRPPQPSLPRSPGHHAEWLRACKGGAAPMSNFADYACQLTETALLGNVAMRVGEQIRWDSANLRATGLAAADQYIRREYRKGWTI
jgi:predicted dehydrogenase